MRVNKHLTKSLFFLLFVVINSCMLNSSCTTKQYSVSSIAGVYKANFIAYGRPLKYVIALNPDSTFNYQYQYDLCNFISDGKWYINDGNVIMNSYVNKLDGFEVKLEQEDSHYLPESIIIKCDNLAYGSNNMFLLNEKDTIAVKSDTIYINNVYYPVCLKLLILSKVPSRVSYAISEPIHINHPGVFRIETLGIFLHEKPLDYITKEDALYRILKRDKIQDVEATNITLQKQQDNIIMPESK